MKIIKTTSKTYDIAFYPNSHINFTAKEFREARESAKMSTSKFIHCFCCGHKFRDDEKLIVITVKGEGNRFACGQCLEKELSKEG